MSTVMDEHRYLIWLSFCFARIKRYAELTCFPVIEDSPGLKVKYIIGKYIIWQRYAVYETAIRKPLLTEFEKNGMAVNVCFVV